MSIRSLVLLAVLVPSVCMGMETMLQDVFYQEEEDHIALEIRLGFPVEIREMLRSDDRTLTLSLKSLLDGSNGAWRAAELKFDEADRVLETVAIEGRDNQGYELRIQFSTAIEAQILPQFDDRQVLIKLSRRKAYRALKAFGKPAPGDPYVINLESRKQSVPDLQDVPKSVADSHTIYIADHEQDDVRWHRLRLGFFHDEQTANRMVRALSRYFPDAWIAQVSAREVRFAEAFRINPVAQVTRISAQASTAAVPQTSKNDQVQLSIELNTPSSIGTESETQVNPNEWSNRDPVTPDPPTELESLLEDARAAFGAENWDRAIALYTKLLNTNQEPYRQQALEMLGVARELNGQQAHAKRYYETYLADYPGTEDARRVDQRLATLVALDQPRSGATSQLARRQAETWRVGAQISQFYQRHSLKIDDRSRVPIDGIFNDFNLLTRRDGRAFDQELRVSMSYLWDFTDNERLKSRAYQVSTAYWEGLSDRLRTAIRLGRQSRWDSGALGRFDGASLDFRPGDNLALGLTGGYLIDASFEGPDSNRPFFGVNGEYLSNSGNLSLKPFYIQQYVDGLLDRRALGLQSQLYTQRLMLFSLIDYDLHHSALNNVTLTGNFSFGRSKLSASYEHRMNPYLTTRNALMGQRFEDLTELEEAILDLSLEEIAKDRTATSSTVRLGLNTKLGDHWNLSADIVASDFSSTESSADIPGLEAQNTLYSSVQLRSSEVFGRGSYSAVMVRIADSQSSATTSLYWDNRLNFGDSWYLYPRFRVDHRSFERTDDKQWSLRPSLRLDYRLSRKIRFELESGYQWTTREMLDRELNITGVFVRAGYRASL